MISRIGRILVGVALSGALVFACTPSVGDDVMLGAASPPAPSFSSPDAGASGIDASNEELRLCPSNECPSPLLTCATSTYLCDVDPLSDDQNCGACGNVCAGYVPALNAAFTCVNGTCALRCAGGGAHPAADCDGIPDNGCEARLYTNEHCSSCNDACTAPDTCQRGVCTECMPPEVPTACGCKDLATDDFNCGACGVECNPQPPDFPQPPPNAYYGCGGGVCDQLKCDNRPRRGKEPTRWTDCNGDLDKPNSDGCEVDLRIATNDHCGGCDIQCAPGQSCAFDGYSNSQWPQCLCKPGDVYCGTDGRAIFCADLDTDPLNCGACGRVCPDPGTISHGRAVCRAGSCAFTCDVGWADCNGFDRDGCETNVHHDPANCGVCGHLCDGGATQACVAGRCAVEDCEGTKPQ